ncbi:kinase-like domain-containing protein [Rhizophagus diaphanus]|nr:kinase-like domain-containing protein [Rhizophagus diaphanus] [Rhizophagus sp. MUCL 43196]
MSKDTTILDIITERNIKLYEYKDLEIIQPIESGAFGKVYKAKQTNSNHFFALKIFDNDNQTIEGVIKELELHLSVNHENIIRLFGITKVTNAIEKYSFVLEYADSGTLDTYLNEHFKELNWSDKYHLGLQLANAIKFLHEKDIIHRDLHGKNVLIHQKSIKLTDFGLSKNIAKTSLSSIPKIFGVLPYMDPKKLNDINYKLDKKSDVYSIGVLLWQISSGRKPFYEINYDASLGLSIVNGKREKIIDETPVEYSELYQVCWRYEPDKRHNMQEIVSILISVKNNLIIDNNTNEKKEIYSMDECEINSESSKGTMDLNNECINNELLSIVSSVSIIDNNEKKEIYSMDECEINSESSKGTTVLNNECINNELSSVSSGSNKNIDLNNKLRLFNGEFNIVKYENEMSSRNKNYANSLLSVSLDQATISSTNLINFLDVNKLITFVIEKHDSGMTFNQVQQLISK